MTDYNQLAGYFKALSHPVRLQILDMLRQGEMCVCHIEAALRKRQAYVSQQLIILRESGLVETRKNGLQVFYRLADPSLETLLDMTLGAQNDSEYERIPGCRCPHCQLIPIPS